MLRESGALWLVGLSEVQRASGHLQVIEGASRPMVAAIHTKHKTIPTRTSMERFVYYELQMGLVAAYTVLDFISPGRTGYR